MTCDAAGYPTRMAGIYDETALAPGEGQRYEIGSMLLHVNRTPQGDWMVDAGGTDVVTISPAEGGFFVTAGAAPAHRSAFPAAMQLALRRLGF